MQSVYGVASNKSEQFGKHLEDLGSSSSARSEADPENRSQTVAGNISRNGQLHEKKEKHWNQIETKNTIYKILNTEVRHGEALVYFHILTLCQNLSNTSKGRAMAMAFRRRGAVALLPLAFLGYAFVGAIFQRSRVPRSATSPTTETAACWGTKVLVLLGT